MPKFARQGNVTLEALAQEVESKFPSQHNVVLKALRLEVIQDALRGCVVKVKQTDGNTEVTLAPFVPSTGLAIVISLLCVGSALLVMLFVNVILGAVLLPLCMLIRLLPSSGLVNQVKDSLVEP